MALKPGYMKWKQARQISAVSTVANAASATAGSATQQAEALAAASGAVNAPTYTLAYYPSWTVVTLTCTTPSSSIQYQIDGGGYGAYSSPVTVYEGETLDAYATAAGLTDSGVITVYG